MKKRLFLIFFGIAAITRCVGQDSIFSRVIFIGDAGEINPEQSAVIPSAADHILPGRTTVVYLGDNIYPRGMGLPGSPEEEQTKKILQSQFIPMRGKGAPVWFIPGNHDWDRMGKLGLSRIKREWAWLNEQHDSLLRLVPPDGCPDPMEISVSDDLVIIAFDSEWWLFPYDKDNPDADCDCGTVKDILGKMDALLYRNRNKVILLASHHPFQSYGTHGGNFSWKDHLFPFTALHKNLYIPLPVIGSLYPVLRSSVFLNPEDLHHPLYKGMISQVDQVFDGFPNLIHVAGHDHGLQFIKDQQVQIISGAGAKHTFVRKGRHALFADATQGFVTVDQLAGKDTRITYYTYSGKGVTTAFSYTQPYTVPLGKQGSSGGPGIGTDGANARTESAGTGTDSITIRANPAYDKVGRFHRKLFGENFRKEWAAGTVVPVIRISAFQGGLRPLQRGGGMQSTSLRLEDKTGREWVIRSVNKNPDPLLPEALRQTFARDFLDDATSGQHPYSALIVPPIASAVGVPHANPVIGIIAADTALGGFNRLFANTLCLVEEREPLGKSDNTGKMIRNLVKDNDNHFDAREFLRARMLDLLLGDWDRHEDQWRWKDEAKKKKEKSYIAVPRDRDQVLHLTDGLFPSLAARGWVLPTLQGFGGDIPHVQYSLFKTNFLNAYPDAQLSREEWKAMADDFVKKVTDEVLEDALRRLPAASYALRHDQLSKELKERRDRVPAAMDEFYCFINRIVDIRASDKNELVEISDRPDNALNVRIRKINKDGEVKGVLMDKTYPATLTREIRVYTGGGDDSVVVDNRTSSIRLRLIGGTGTKSYNIIDSKNAIRLYDKLDSAAWHGEARRLRKHLSQDTSITSFVPVNLYNTTMPLVSAGFNVDDGILFGGGFRHIQQYGFRKKPYASVQEFQAMHSFATGAFKIKYRGEWLDVLGKADFVLDAKALAPDNAQNFFGVGNATEFDKTGDYKRYYRARFALYQADPALRWRTGKDVSLSVGPSLQYYHFNDQDNIGRFINNVSLIHSYDSATIADDKMFAGLVANFIVDNRNSKILPVSGGYFSVKLMGYSGLNSYSKSFVQVLPELAVYKGIDRQSNIVLSDRVGGGITGGKTTFYQSLFLGGQGNLYGFRQFRFAGQYMLYNNLEARIKIAQVGSYILPGQLGLVGFYDAGKVWADGYNSATIHTGVGGGIYFAPAQLVVLQLIAGHSAEGWYPYFTMGFRF
ncbi:MAG: BamA/TamA family outer membrane protein [Puia sp.]|nr:BamA/TamA family outer membrane protein [Puia sp.]